MFRNNSIERSESNQGFVQQNTQIDLNKGNGEEIFNTKLILNDQFSNNSQAGANFSNSQASKSSTNSKSDDLNIQITKNPSDEQESYSINKNITSYFNHENSTAVAQGQHQIIVSDGYDREIQNYDNQLFWNNGNNSVSAQGSGFLDLSQNYTHSVSNIVNGTNTTVVDVNGTQQNTDASYYGGTPQIDQTESKTHVSYSDQTQTQQFTSLRGAKKSTGGWKQVEVQELLNSNTQIAEEAIQAVSQKFQPEQDGYEFDSVLSVQEQIVSGFNYQIKLLYINAEGDSRIYQVIIYSIPWTNEPDQIVSCHRLDN